MASALVSPSPTRTTAPRKQVSRWVADHLVLMVGIVVLLYMFVPIGYIVALSFNQPSGRRRACASRSGSASRSASRPRSSRPCSGP